VTGIRGAAEHLIRRACRRLPADAADERCREWTAEVRAILDDPDLRPGILRWARALRYAAGIVRCARHPELAGRRGDGRTLARRLVTGVIIYLCVVGTLFGFVLAFSPQGPWPLVALLGCCVCFDVFCLTDLARARTVRYLPKWAWVLACLWQTPLGGIMYLSTGRDRS
jgi:Phospholipase_D-nuclease N-terminal